MVDVSIAGSQVWSCGLYACILCDLKYFLKYANFLFVCFPQLCLLFVLMFDGSLQLCLSCLFSPSCLCVVCANIVSSCRCFGSMWSCRLFRDLFNRAQSITHELVALWQRTTCWFVWWRCVHRKVRQMRKQWFFVCMSHKSKCSKFVAN